MSSSQHASKNYESSGDESNFSYYLVMKHNDETIHSHTHIYNDKPQITIVAALEEPVYSGNYYLPFVKNFKMTYQCVYKTTKSESGQSVQGEIGGEISAEFSGLCTRKKAKELVFDHARKNVKKYLKDNLNR